jgi:transposase
VKATLVIDVVDTVEESETQENAPRNGGSSIGHGLGTSKTCSICGKVGFNRRTHPRHVSKPMET